MRFKCVYNTGSDIRLTIGKVYDCIITDHSKELYDKQGLILITDNLGDKLYYYIKGGDRVWFENTIAEDRDIKINNLIKKERH